jgi:hypothetical protein
MKTSAAGAGILRRRRRRSRLLAPVIVLVLAVLALYIGAAMLSGSWLVERAIARVEQQRPELRIAVGTVRVQPFTWRVRLTDVQVTDSGSGEFLEAPAITAFLHPDSLMSGVIRLTRVEVPEPAVALRVGSAARPVGAGGPGAAARAFDPVRRLQRLAGVRIDQLSVEGGRLMPLPVTPEAVGGPGGQPGDPGALPLATFTLSATSWPPATGAPAPWTVDLRPASGGRISIAGDAMTGETLARGRVQLAGVEPAVMAGMEVLAGDLQHIAELAGTVDVTGEFRAVTGSARSAVQIVTDVDLRGHLAVAGPVTMSLTLDSADAGGPAFLWLQLHEVPSALVSRYTEHVFGLAAESHGAELTWQYRREQNRLNGQLDLSVRDLVLAAPDDGAMALNSDPALTVALLRDADDTIALTVSVESAVDARTQPVALTDRSLQALLARLPESPFHALAELSGQHALDDTLRFVPGDVAPIASAEQTVRALAEALRLRPGVGLELTAPFDPELDRQNLAIRQVELHVTLATAAAEFGARAAELDFASPRVHDVLEEFAGERLEAGALGRLRMRFGFEAGQVPSGAPVAYYRALFDALAANERIEDTALTRLARFRAQSVISLLSAEGIDGERLSALPAAPVPAQDRQWFYVPGPMRLVAAGIDAPDRD